MKAETKPIIYVTRDIERALGIELGVGLFGANYFIIANHTPYAELITKKYPNNIWLVDSPDGTLLDTFDILNLPEVKKEITKSTLEKGARLLVFKNTERIETLARENKWNLLNPPAELAEKIENKITQVSWLGDLTRYLPPHEIRKARDIKWEAHGKKPLIIQWAHGHTGTSTILVTKEAELKELVAKFPDRDARISEYVRGPSFTLNIISPTQIGNLSYQITGALPFTDNPLSTIGNDWSLPHSILTEAQLAKVDEIAQVVAKRMSESGWRGLFGIDLIHDEERDVIYLIEINARQPASTTYESQLQTLIRAEGVAGMTMFEAHIAALTNDPSAKTKPVTEKIIPINDGVQIIQRVTAINLKSGALPNVQKLESAGHICIPYTNTKIGSDLLRIQSLQGIMEAHNKFNSRGKLIVELVTEK